jgi:hypothetical protein
MEGQKILKEEKEDEVRSKIHITTSTEVKERE